MKRSRYKMLLVLIVILGGFYLIVDVQRSFRTIEEAIHHQFETSSRPIKINQIIGGSEYDRKAFYFVLSDNKIYDVRLNKGLFGWWFDGATFATGLEINREYPFSVASVGSTNDLNKFYFGLTSIDHASEVLINESYQANLIRLEDGLAETEHLKNAYLWYVHFKHSGSSDTVKYEVFDKDGNLLIQK